MSATRITYEQYVSTIECGGRALAFYVDEGGDEEAYAIHALKYLTMDIYDELPDEQCLTGQRYYTLTE